ncbi:MAG: rRNA maturation RNase YbeY [Bacteroidia bacterium]
MITFHIEKKGFKLAHKLKLKSWIKSVIATHSQQLSELNYIFVSDEELYQINLERLQHNYYTDIITFYYHAENQPIMSDIYISVDRVAENAKDLGANVEDELHRVMIHGVLHLLGFDDHGETNAKEMRNKEDVALAMRNFL